MLMTVGSVPEALKLKGRAKAQNGASKKLPLADTDKDVGVLELKEQPAAHNTPPIQPAAKEADATQDTHRDREVEHRACCRKKLYCDRN